MTETGLPYPVAVMTLYIWALAFPFSISTCPECITQTCLPEQFYNSISLYTLQVVSCPSCHVYNSWWIYIVVSESKLYTQDGSVCTVARISSYYRDILVTSDTVIECLRGNSTRCVQQWITTPILVQGTPFLKDSTKLDTLVHYKTMKNTSIKYCAWMQTVSIATRTDNLQRCWN